MNCPNCGSEITFWTSLRQPTPFRYRCGTCRTKFKVETPGMRTILLLVVLIFAALFAVLIVGAERWWPTFALILALWFLLEIWTHRYISRRGVFTAIAPASTTRDEKPVRSS